MTLHDPTYDIGQKAKFAAEIGLHFAGCYALSNRNSEIPRDASILGLMRIGEAKLDRPSLAFQLCNKFKVGQAAAKLVSVNMVENETLPDRTHKCEPNDPMREAPAKPARMTERDSFVRARAFSALRIDELSLRFMPPRLALDSRVSFDPSVRPYAKPVLLDGASNIVHGRRVVPVSHAHALAWPNL